jgi:hypothetical protein
MSIVANNVPLSSLISTLDASATLFMNSTDASVVDKILLSPDVENVCGQGLVVGQSVLPIPYPCIPSRVGNKNYPSFVGSALDLDHLKNGLIRELSRSTATIQIAHFQVCNCPLTLVRNKGICPRDADDR